MKRSITFIVPGEPQGKQRVRSTVARGRIHTYNPERNEEEANRTLFWFLQAVRESGEIWQPLERAVVDIIAYYGVPQSWSKAKRTAALAGELVPTRKPDLDNIAKLVLDALNGVAYVDDRYVGILTVCKRYSDTPRLVVGVSEM